MPTSHDPRHVPPPQHGEDNTYAGHLVMFPSGWGFFDLNPDPVVAGAHMIVEDPPQVSIYTTL